MSVEGDGAEVPEYLRFPGIEEVDIPPQHLLEFLKWIREDTERAVSAAEAARRLKIGIIYVPLGTQIVKREVVKKRQINWRHPEFPPEVGAGAHAHGRASFSRWFIPRGGQLEIDRSKVLPDGAKKPPGLDAQWRLFAVNNKVEDPSHFGPSYNPFILGPRWVVREVVTVNPEAEWFDSVAIHDIRHKGDGTVVSVQDQFEKEPPELSELKQLMWTKGLAYKQAVDTVEQRRTIKDGLPGTASLGPATALIREPDFEVDQMEPGGMKVDPRFFIDELLPSSIRTMEQTVGRA